MYIFALHRTLFFDVTAIIHNINWKVATGPEKLRTTLQYLRPNIQQISILNIVCFSYSRISGTFFYQELLGSQNMLFGFFLTLLQAKLNYNI
jgi:hypothetical protein